MNGSCSESIPPQRTGASDSYPPAPKVKLWDNPCVPTNQEVMLTPGRQWVTLNCDLSFPVAETSCSAQALVRSIQRWVFCLVSDFLKIILLLFNYSCLHFLPTPGF